MSGKFITFEGPEGGGKSTHLRLAAEFLKEQEIPHIVTREPGGPPISERIRSIILDPMLAEMTDRTELLLILAARAQHTDEVLLPALEAGKIVLCDRYNDSTLAYQSFGRGFDFELTRNMCTFASHNLTPNLTLLFDIDVTVGIERSRAIHKEDSPIGVTDRMESEELVFHERVRQGFLELARGNPYRFRVFDGNHLIVEIQRKVREEIEKILKAKGQKCL